MSKNIKYNWTKSKSDVFFNEGYLCNGIILLDVNKVENANSVKQGMKYDIHSKSYYETTCPHLEALIRDAKASFETDKDNKYIRAEATQVATTDHKGKLVNRVYSFDNEDYTYFVMIDKGYAEILSEYYLYKDKGGASALVIADDRDNFAGVVMPVTTNGRHDLEYLIDKQAVNGALQLLK